MIIKSLELKNFRNYEQLKIDFHNGVNIIYGDNAQGKTNILESIYLAATTKSHRSNKDKEIIKLNENEAHIRMMVEKSKIDHRIDMHLKKEKSKGIAIDGIPIRKSSEPLGFLKIVFFSPEDLSIIKNGPSERRRFIDMELCQLDRLYLYNLSMYNKILVQRNNLLKQIAFQRDLLDTLSIWDSQLIEAGCQIIKRRKEFIKQLNSIILEIHRKLTGGKEELLIYYEPNVETEDFQEKLIKNLDRDIQSRLTSIGPHRDDIMFIVKNIDLRKYGSQGQQRTAALSLKLAEIDLVKHVSNHYPILLLDDVLSELDRNRQNYLLDSIYNIQTFVTCTGLEEFVNKRGILDRVFKVVNGTVTRQVIDEKGNQR